MPSRASWKCAPPLISDVALVHRTQCGIRESQIARMQRVGNQYTVSLILLLVLAEPNMAFRNIIAVFYCTKGNRKVLPLIAVMHLLVQFSSLTQSIVGIALTTLYFLFGRREGSDYAKV